MSVKHLAFGIFLVVLLASCDNPRSEVVIGLDKTPTVAQGVLATAVQKTATPFPILPTITQTLMEILSTPTVTPTANGLIPLATLAETSTAVPSLGFSELYFSRTAEGAAQSEFPAGTDEVFAVWDYAGMSATDNVRRIWFRDDQIWLTREEGWNWGEFGSDGTMRQISVYDDEGSGLASATYRLQLYVNDALQAEARFVIMEP